MVQGVAEREERIRDLKKQVSELDHEEDTEVLFQEISPRRRRVTLYSTTDGEPIPVPEYMVRAALGATGPDGSPRFVSKQENAPEYRLGEIKCFLHPESPERPILKEIGLAGTSCNSGHLASAHSKRLHAQSRHKHEWAALQEYLNNQKTAEYEARQQAQLEATLEIAQKAAGQPIATEPKKPIVPCPVEGCNYQGTKKQLSGHRMAAHRRMGADNGS